MNVIVRETKETRVRVAGKIRPVLGESFTFDPAASAEEREKVLQEWREQLIK